MKSLFSNKHIQRFVLVWLVYWLSVMGFKIFILKPMGFTFTSGVGYVISYFLFFAGFGFFLFRSMGEMAPLKNYPLQLPVTFLSGIVFCGISLALRPYLPISPENYLYIEKMGFLYPLLTNTTVIGKYSDIIFQQTLIVSLVLFLKKNCRRPREVVEIFTFVFFILHVPLFLEFGLMALIFIVPSLFAGAIFSFLITFYSWGVLGSMLVHQYYYIAMVIILRLLYRG